MVLTRLTAAEPYTSGRLDVVVDLDPADTVGALEGTLTGLPPSAQTQLWLDGRELPRTATVGEAGIRDGALLFVGGPGPASSSGAGLELRLVSGPSAGQVHPLPEGDTVIGGEGAGIALAGITGDRLLLRRSFGSVVATSLDPQEPVRRAGVALQTTVALSLGDQVAIGPHLLAVEAALPATPAAERPGVTVARRPRQRVELGQHALQVPVPPSGPDQPRLAVVPALVPLVLGLVLGLLLSPLFLLIALVSPAVVYAKRWSDLRASAAAFDQRVADYDQALADVAAEGSRLMQAELTALREAAPDPVTLLRSATEVDQRVWERSRTDDDRLLLRVGTTATHAMSWRVGEDPAQLLHDVPATLPLRRTGTLAVTGEGCQALARWLVAQAAVLYSPEDLTIWLLAGDPDAAKDCWDWLRWLPHTRGAPEVCANLVATTEESLTARFAELTALLAERRALRRPAADVLVVLDGDLSSRAETRELLRDGPAAGVFTICVGTTAPKSCRTQVSLEAGARLTVTGTGALPVRDVRGDLVSADWADRVGRALAPLRPAEPGPGQLPYQVSLLDLVADEPVAQRWAAGAAPVVGATAQGPLELDGGHLLIAGSDPDQTRSLLQAVVLSLALHRSPDALGMVLVGDLPELGGLPHVSSTLHRPDGSEAARVLASLAAELRRRERVPAGGPRTPQLVLVVAEASDLGGFTAQLAGLLEGSEPLGVQLVAATASPASLPDSVLAVLTRRLVLRVERRDSERLLGSPVAASLLPEPAGRGYQRSAEGVLPFQAATVTARRSTGRQGLHAEELPWERLSQPLRPAEQPQPVLAELVASLQAQGVAAPESPWAPPLPDRVELHDLDAGEGWGRLALGLEDLPGEQAQRSAVYDLENQSSLLVVGGSRSGRSTLLLTLAASLASSYSSSDVHLYAIDCGSRALPPLSGLPHCGAVVTADDPDRADRLLTRLSAELARRRRQLAERGFTDLAAQRRGTADPLPYLLLLIDGWEGFEAALGRIGDGRLVESLEELVREGGPAGLRVILTGDSSVLASPVAAAMPERLVLRLDAADDYSAAGIDPATVPERVPSGRAFRARPDEVRPAVDSVQIAVLAGDLRELAAGLPPARGRRPFRVDVLPAALSWAEAHRLTPSGPGAGLAVGGDELRLQAVNLLTCGPGFTVAGPPGSGRSTALVVLARSLLEAGTQLCLLTPVPSPLSELRGAPGVLLAADKPKVDELERVVERATGQVAVLVDDADQQDDEQLDSWLRQLLRDARSRDHSLVVAGDTNRLASSTTGFGFEARRSRSGLLLTPSSVDEGDLLGVRLERSAVFDGPVGRGLLVRSGQVQLVQVPRPD